MHSRDGADLRQRTAILGATRSMANVVPALVQVLLFLLFLLLRPRRMSARTASAALGITDRLARAMGTKSAVVWTEHAEMVSLRVEWGVKESMGPAGGKRVYGLCLKKKKKVVL